jgi:hypothetical protein
MAGGQSVQWPCRAYAPGWFIQGVIRTKAEAIGAQPGPFSEAANVSQRRLKQAPNLGTGAFLD